MEKSSKVPDLVKEKYEELPSLDDGRIDYREANTIPTVTSFVYHDGEVLLLKRGESVSKFKNSWSVVTGYFDRLVPVEEIAFNELVEETGISLSSVSSVKLGDRVKFWGMDCFWVTFPVLFGFNDRPEVSLNWEHTDYKWIDFQNLSDWVPSSFVDCFGRFFDF